jgi:Histidine kinase-, DNA gyrase B-, and HSP90-like ATPase
MRFKANERLIDIMVGQFVYDSPEVAMRELLQNAEDACALQEIKASSYTARIDVRYSIRDNWVEVADNGLGMNAAAIEQSFAAVGAPKDDVPHIRALLDQAGGNGNRQIGQFGVGILSCFGVAENVVVWTKMDEDNGLAFTIPNHHADFEDRPDIPTERGTRIRLNLKTDGNMRAEQVPGAVKKYIRHAKHVTLQDADSGAEQEVLETWHGKSLPGAVPIEDTEVRDGFLALHSGWDEPGGTLQSELVICNGGFLVKEREPTLLPPECIGYAGEIDVKPQALSIRLNREGFVEDAKWQRMRTVLTATYNRLIREKISDWERKLQQHPNGKEMDIIEKGVLLLLRTSTNSILDLASRDRLQQLFPKVVRLNIRGAAHATSIDALLDKAKERGVIYFIRDGEAPRQFQQSIPQGTGSVQVMEFARTGDMRAINLQAKGAIVLLCRQRPLSFMAGPNAQNISVHEVDLISGECQQRGIQFTSVNDASAEDVELMGAPQSGLLSGLLGWGDEFKLLSFEGSDDRVIRDFAGGRLLNCSHAEVREVLAYLPDAVGNPVRKALLQIYMDVQTYKFDTARLKAKELLTMPDLAEQAQLMTGVYLREFLQEKLRPLLDPPKDPA